MKGFLIGEKLGHSFSAEIHESLGLYSYCLQPLSGEEFSSFMEKKDFDFYKVFFNIYFFKLIVLLYAADTASITVPRNDFFSRA